MILNFKLVHGIKRYERSRNFFHFRSVMLDSEQGNAHIHPISSSIQRTNLNMQSEPGSSNIGAYPMQQQSSSTSELRMPFPFETAKDVHPSFQSHQQHHRQMYPNPSQALYNHDHHQQQQFTTPPIIPSVMQANPTIYAQDRKSSPLHGQMPTFNTQSKPLQLDCALH